LSVKIFLDVRPAILEVSVPGQQRVCPLAPGEMKRAAESGEAADETWNIF
jgi:hypothetical protein